MGGGASVVGGGLGSGWEWGWGGGAGGGVGVGEWRVGAPLSVCHGRQPQRRHPRQFRHQRTARLGATPSLWEEVRWFAYALHLAKAFLPLRQCRRYGLHQRQQFPARIVGIYGEPTRDTPRPRCLFVGVVDVAAVAFGHAWLDERVCGTARLSTEDSVVARPAWGNSKFRKRNLTGVEESGVISQRRMACL